MWNDHGKRFEISSYRVRENYRICDRYSRQFKEMLFQITLSVILFDAPLTERVKK